MISKHIYSWVVVEGRKRKAEKMRFDRDHKTPTQKRALLGSKCNRKLVTRCLAPLIIRQPAEKRNRTTIDSPQMLAHRKRQRSPPKNNTRKRFK